MMRKATYVVATTITIGVLIVFVVLLVYDIRSVDSKAMLDTLDEGDRVLVEDVDVPSRGDVVTIRRTGGDETILRVIGLPGERVTISEDAVLINGKVLEEPYLRPGTAMASFGPVAVPPGEYLVLGDNRESAIDSRVTGTVVRTDIAGRVVAIAWPPRRWGGV